MEMIRWLFLAVAFCGSVAQGAPSFISVVVDKANYNSEYVVGVDAYFSDPSNNVSRVEVNHVGASGSSFGPWELNELSTGRWWNWADTRITMSNGLLDGILAVSVETSGEVDPYTAQLRLQPREELAIPQWTISKGETGYKINTQLVVGADYYNLWLWDWTDHRYASEQQVVNVTDLKEISFDGLVDGRTYNMYLIANNAFSGGDQFIPSSILYRSYDLQYITYFSENSVPEPGSFALMVFGLAGLPVARRRKHA